MYITRLMTSPQVTIFAGRFGSGKTEIALNYAVALHERGLDPYLVDLDVVTPYFRTRDRAAEMASMGVQVVSPFPAGHDLHVPAVSPQIQGAIEQPTHPVVVDLGGDEQGARILAMYAGYIRSRAYAMHLIVNPYRPFMDTISGIERAVEEIAASTRLPVTDLVSNPNLMSESSPELFMRGHCLIERASRQLDLPIAFAVASRRLAEQLDRERLGVDLLVIRRYFPMFDPPEPRNDGGDEGLS
jgi:hypothetical protein